MSDYEPTIKIRRPPRIQTDGHGRSVWTDPVDTSDELELVSTQALRVILDADDKQARKAIQAAVKGSNEGVLARDPTAGTFEIIGDDELQKILDSTLDLPPITRPADITLVPLNKESSEELSLVSTQALRKILGTGDSAPAQKSKKKRDSSGGFDPYNSG
ncbi:MAG: hypothetical protein OEV63_03670 [Gammaproteobacteria bacterium]|nr:hypothetical protein [Gammaproteobacteria bacterium]MDH5214926.1 hypothetical protein [Gammaproteobacteria bacterium]